VCYGFNFQTAKTVVVSAAKQSIAQQTRKNGLLRCARNDGRTRLPDLAACFARGLQEMSALEKSEGAGNAGRSMHPQSGGQKRVEGRTSVVTTRLPEQPSIPRAMVLTGYFVLSPVYRAC
jgi:hypothetical protein